MNVISWLVFAGALVLTGGCALASAALTVASLRAHRGPALQLAGVTALFGAAATLIALLIYDALTLS